MSDPSLSGVAKLSVQPEISIVSYWAITAASFMQDYCAYRDYYKTESRPSPSRLIGILSELLRQLAPYIRVEPRDMAHHFSSVEAIAKGLEEVLHTAISKALIGEDIPKDWPTKLSGMVQMLQVEVSTSYNRFTQCASLGEQEAEPHSTNSPQKQSRGARSKNDDLLDFDERSRKTNKHLTDKEVLAAFRKKHPKHPIFQCDKPESSLRAARSRRKRKST